MNLREAAKPLKEVGILTLLLSLPLMVVLLPMPLLWLYAIFIPPAIWLTFHSTPIVSGLLGQVQKVPPPYLLLACLFLSPAWMEHQ
jgi:hypothetical protein